MRGAALLEHLRSIPFDERDVAVDALLGICEVPPDTAELPRGAVPYLPCGVDEIIAMVLEAPVSQTDTFVDLGSGIGRVAILVHLLTGARTRGIEIQAPLVATARGLGAGLALSEDAVSFLHGDAASKDLEGTIFFLYAPFSGEILQRVLARLAAVARRHRIVVGTVGFEIQDAPWLRARATSYVALSLYDSTDSIG